MKTIAQIRKSKKELESVITEMIIEYECINDVKISSINSSFHSSNGGLNEAFKKVEIKIEI